MSLREDPLGRLNNFKNKGKTPEGMKRNRSEESVQLRIARKDSQLSKKRNIILNSVIFNDELLSHDDEDENQRSVDFRNLFSAFQTRDGNKILNAVQSFHESFGSSQNLPIEMMIEAGLVPAFVNLLDVERKEHSSVQLFVAWALANIAAGTCEQTKTVIEAGAIPKFVALLDSPSPLIVEQAVLAIGNIAGDGPEARDLVLSHHVMNCLLRLIEPEPSCTVSCLRNIVWAISNLCRNRKPPTDLGIVRSCIPYLSRLLYYEDSDVLAHACWALFYLMGGAKENIQIIIDENIIPRLVDLLSHQSHSVITPALRVIGHVVTGNDEQTDAVITSKVLPKLQLLLHSTQNNFVRESAWIISNITAGTVEQIQRVIDARILKDLVDVLRRGDLKTQKESAWAVTNFTRRCTVHQLYEFLPEGLIPAFCGLLKNNDLRTISVVLNGILHIFRLSEEVNEHIEMALEIEECGGSDLIKKLQNHPNDEICNKASKIVRRYFFDVDEDEVIFPESNTK